MPSEMLPSLDNYISYGQDVFVANQQIQGMMFDIIETVSSFSNACKPEILIAHNDYE